MKTQMRHYIMTLLAIICMAAIVNADPVSKPEAQKIAVAFYSHYAPGSITDFNIAEEGITSYGNIVTFYTFYFSSGGFVIVAADDASIPVLGYSFKNQAARIIENPATQEWFDDYSQQIYQIIKTELNNRETVKQWDAIRRGNFPPPGRDVDPLLTSIWWQGEYYNDLCPADPAGPGGHCVTGCVATCMAQIMKFHNFPPSGVGFHSYPHPEYGVLSVDFANTTYDWASMPDEVTSSNIPVATIMYHAGVSVDMNYGPSGSGTFSELVPDALLDYFNYHPDIEIQFQSDYPDPEDWKNMLRTDLDNQLPIYYSGRNTSGGHAFVCDGYRMSDGMFHFNWGWGGNYDGWFAIGALNPGSYTYNLANKAVIQIKPYNPNLITRITQPIDNAVICAGNAVDIDASTVFGTSSLMKITIDGEEVATGNSNTLNYTWNTSINDLGSHEVITLSYAGDDTVFYKINLNIAEWGTQASAFQTPLRSINYMSAVDSNIVWAVARDGIREWDAPVHEFTRTTDGGATWTAGNIGDLEGLGSSMIFGVSADIAYVPMYLVSGSNLPGLYSTTDGGLTWNRQATVFNNSSSFANCIHFFNENEGWCMGDPINGEYEIYTTTDGGTNWIQVPGENLPDAISGEYGFTGGYSAVNDTIWFGTNAGRIYRSADKGHNWTVSVVMQMLGEFTHPVFRNGSHGLAHNFINYPETGMICETFDGGETWTEITSSGPLYWTDIAYVPGTINTWVSTGGRKHMPKGASYSFDGGHTWTAFQGTEEAEFRYMSWLDNTCGWAGGFSVNDSVGGIFKFMGELIPPPPAPINLQAEVLGNDVHLSWDAPASGNPGLTLLGYNMYRDSVKLNTDPISELFYDDPEVINGLYTYCVTALYDDGESDPDCVIVDIAVGIGKMQDPRSRIQVNVYPNPMNEISNFQYSISNFQFVTLQVLDVRGHIISSLVGEVQRPGEYVVSYDASGLPGGVYIIRLQAGSESAMARLVVVH